MSSGVNIEYEAKECLPSDNEYRSVPGPIEKEAELFLTKLNALIVRGDAALDAKEYRNQYETLLGALKLGHSREASLDKQCQKLEEQSLTANQSQKDMEGKVHTLQSDLDTIKSLLASSNSREDRAKALVSKLHDELERLTDLVDKSEVATTQKDTEIKRLSSDVEEWKNNATRASEKINAMDIEQQKQKSQIEQLRLASEEMRNKNIALEEQICERDDEVKRQNGHRRRVETELDETQAKLESKTKECIDLQYNINMTESRIGSLEGQLIQSKKAAGAREEELKNEMVKTANMTTSLGKQRQKSVSLSEKLSQAEKEVKKRGNEINRLKLDKSQLERSLESEKKSLLRQQQLVEDGKAAHRIANDKIELLKKELDAKRKRENQCQREILMLKRENAMATGRIQQSEDKAKKTGQDLQHNEQIIASLEKELAEAHGASAKQEIETRRLESECDALRHQVKDSSTKYERLADEMKMQKNKAKELNAMLEETQSQIDAGKKLHDATRVDMNNTLKDLTDAQREINELEEDKKSSQRLIDSLRSEITMKESCLVREHYECSREKAQKELYADEMSRLKKSIAENESSIRTHQSEVRNLGTTIRKLENSASTQRREYDHAISERDILGTQLIRRNDEVALLHEKVKILKNTQNRGEVQYNARLDDIRILKVKVRDLQRQLVVSKGGQAGVGELLRNLTLVKKELAKERLKVKALSDELENPLNVHRWRKLEGSDPAAYEMIQKIQLLQKRLLLKSEEIERKNSVIKEHEKRKQEMEKTIARQPGPDVSEQLNFFQNDARKKTKQMKAMAGELNMHQTQVIYDCICYCYKL